jgi:hypothetical protein
MSIKEIIPSQHLKPFDNKSNLHINLGKLVLPIKLFLDYFDLKDYCTFQRIDKSWSKLSSCPYSHTVYATEFHFQHPDLLQYLRYITHLYELSSNFLSSIKLPVDNNVEDYLKTKSVYTPYQFISNLPQLQNIKLDLSSHSDSYSKSKWCMEVISIQRLKNVKFFYRGIDSSSGQWQYGTTPIPAFPIYAPKIFLSAFTTGIDILSLYSNVKILTINLINIMELKQILLLPHLKQLNILSFLNVNNKDDYDAVDKIDWSELPVSKTLEILKIKIYLYLSNFVHWFLKSKIKDLTVSSILEYKSQHSYLERPINYNMMLGEKEFLRFLTGKVLRDSKQNIYYDYEPAHILDGRIEKYYKKISPYIDAKEYYDAKIKNKPHYYDEEDEDYMKRYNDYEETLQKQLLPQYDANDPFNNVNLQSLIQQRAFTPNVTKMYFCKKLEGVYSTIKKVDMYTYMIEDWKSEDFIRQFPNITLMKLTWDSELAEVDIYLTDEKLQQAYEFVLQCLKLNSRLYVKLCFNLSSLIVKFPLVYTARIYS